MTKTETSKPIAIGSEAITFFTDALAAAVRSDPFTRSFYLYIMNTPVSNKQELLELIHAHKQEIHNYGVKQLGIFGSFVRDEVKQSSDIDFLVEFYPDKKNFDNFMELAFFLQNLLGRKVEIVTPQSLSKYIGPYILKEVEYVSFAA
ncbi:MAG TPA: nucleotidyltransferase family protein [Bacteroidia bacterium]|nr:nucleotidyltransferase family protein [Bacteroidia bacterium]